MRGGNNIMKNIFDAELEIIQFNVKDIITTSDITDGDFDGEDIFGQQ